MNLFITRKIKVIFILLILLITGRLSAEDLKQEIGQQGNQAWSEILDGLQAEGLLIDQDTSAGAIASNFRQLGSHYIVFPDFNFEDFVTDRNGNKYYYYGEPDSFDFFVIRYDQEITDILRDYSYLFGPVGDDEWEMIGSVEEVYSWWGDVVFMDVKALRIKDKAMVVKDGNDFSFIGNQLVQQMKQQIANASSPELPQNLNRIPDSLDPRIIADLYWHIASVEDNQQVWYELLSSDNFYNGQPERRVDYWWKSLTTEGRSFNFVRIAEDSPHQKKYFYQITENGTEVGNPKPITLILEDGEWRVKSGF